MAYQSSWTSTSKPIDLYDVIPVVIGSSIWYNGHDGIGEYDTKINNIVKTHKHEDIFSSFNMITPNHTSPSCSIGDKLYIFNGDTGDLIIFNTTSKKVEAVKYTEVIGHNASCIYSI